MKRKNPSGKTTAKREESQPEEIETMISSLFSRFPGGISYTNRMNTLASLVSKSEKKGILPTKEIKEKRTIHT